MVVVLERKMYKQNTAVRTTVEAIHLFQHSFRIHAAGIQTQRRLPAGININAGNAEPGDAEYTAFI